MSHHGERARVALVTALDTLESAGKRSEERTNGPNLDSLDIMRIKGDVSRSLYDTNTAGWTAAERALEKVLKPLSHLAHVLAHGGGKLERSAEEKVVAGLLVDARKSIRRALLNLRLRKGRS